MNKRQKIVIASAVSSLIVWLTMVFAFQAHVAGMVFINGFNLLVLAKERVFLKNHSIKKGSLIKYFVNNATNNIGYGKVSDIKLSNGVVEYVLEDDVLLTHYWSADDVDDLTLNIVGEEEYTLGKLS